MRKQRPKTKISSAEDKGLRALIFCFILSFFLGCATSGGERPFFFSSENSRRGAVEGGEPIPKDLPYDSEEQLREEELRRQAEEEAARMAMEERMAEEQRIAEDAQRRAEMEAAQRAAAEEARRKQEEEAKLAAEKQRQAAEAEKQRQAAEQARLAEEKRRAEEEEEAAAGMPEPEEEETEDFYDEETSTLEPAGDEITPPPVPQEPLTPDFVLTGFKDQEIKVILEGEGWIMANPGPTISFLRKEYSPTGQSIFYLKASENGEYILFYSRSAAVGIEKRVVLLKIVPEHGTEETTAEVIQEPQQPAAEAPVAPPAPLETPSAPAVVRQPGESAGAPAQQETPAQPDTQAQQQQAVPQVPSVPQVPATPSAPAPEAPRATEQIQPPAVVRDLASPPVLPKEPSDNVDVPPAPTPSQTELGTLEEKELKDTFDALRKNPADQNTAIKVGETFLQRFGKSNLAAEVLYYLGQIYETQGPNVDRQKAYDYYSRAYNDYPISPYSRKSKERMNYLEQFYLRLP